MVRLGREERLSSANDDVRCLWNCIDGISTPPFLIQGERKPTRYCFHSTSRGADLLHRAQSLKRLATDLLKTLCGRWSSLLRVPEGASVFSPGAVAIQVVASSSDVRERGRDVASATRDRAAGRLPWRQRQPRPQPRTARASWAASEGGPKANRHGHSYQRRVSGRTRASLCTAAVQDQVQAPRPKGRKMIRRTVRPRTNMLASSAAAVACLVERAPLSVACRKLFRSC